MEIVFSPKQDHATVTNGQWGHSEVRHVPYVYEVYRLLVQSFYWSKNAIDWLR